MLYAAGATKRLGSVVEGNSTLDYEPDEISRQISLGSSIASFNWKKNRINLIDTPGFANFLSDAYSAIRVADGCVMVISAMDGPKVETERVWKQADLFGLPRLVFISEMDKERADFDKVVETLNSAYGNKFIPLYIPDGQGDSFQGIIDLLRMRVFTPDSGGAWGKESQDLNPVQEEKAAQWREKLVEAVAETDDQLLEKYLEGTSLETAELSQALSTAVKNGLLYPVICGAGTIGAGAVPLLDTITDFLPSPLEVGPAKAVVAGKEDESVQEPDENAPFSGLVFKTIADPYAGRLSIFRVYSGTLHADTHFYNSNKETKEKFGQIFHLLGKNQEGASVVVAGDIACVAKLKETVTGESICDEKSPVLFDFIDLPKPAISFAIEPKTKGDDEKVSQSLNRLMEEDPTLQVGRDPQTREMIISGLGQMHLEVVLDRLKRKFGVEVNMKTPKIPYKETIRGTAKVQGKYKKQSGGRGQYGDCWLELEPLPRGNGFEFVDKIVGGVIPRQYIPAVEKGVVSAMEAGPVAGYPVVDMKVTVYDGSFHTVDSSEMAFKIAASMGFKKGVLEAKPVLLEPIMDVEVVTPDEYVGDVIGDLNSRRGRVAGVDSQPSGQVVKVKVPLAEMLKYAPDLRSMTQGRGAFEMEFSHYEEVPENIAAKIIEMYQQEKDSE
jgi:elongation factor G